jgi:hypothetical protein
MSEGKRRHTINWGQAFAEVILIVIGIALALAADDWADRQRELAEEQEYLVRLRADFETTRQSFVETLETIRHNRDTKLRLIELLQGPADAVGEDELSEMIREAIYMQFPQVTLATYSDMVNSGDLRLLRNPDLRLSLAEFESRWGNYQGVLHEGFDQWNQLQVPYLVENSSIPSVFSSGYLGIDFPGSDVPIDRAPIWTQEFQNVLAVSIVSRQDMLVYGQQLLDMAEQVLMHIDESAE